MVIMMQNFKSQCIEALSNDLKCYFIIPKTKKATKAKAVKKWCRSRNLCARGTSPLRAWVRIKSILRSMFDLSVSCIIILDSCDGEIPVGIVIPKRRRFWRKPGSTMRSSRATITSSW